MTTTTSPILANIPAELRARDQWVNWKYLTRGEGKPTKVPFQPDGRPAKSDDPSTWNSIGAVLEAGGFAGIGYVFSEDDPYVGIDLDYALDDSGVLKPGWAAAVERFGTYTEVSPSGKGVKLWVRAEWPGLKSETGKRVFWRDGQIEAYWRGRYFTVTGNLYAGCPTTIAENQDAVNGLYRKILSPEPVKAKLASGSSIERCVAYLRRCPDAVSGSDGHGRTLHAAAECWRFGLTESEAWSVMLWFNGDKCRPVWTERELQHKLDDARGKVLSEGAFGIRQRETALAPARIPIDAPPNDATELSALVEEVISGARVNIAWPWRTLTREARSLLPGTITVFSGIAGSSKSLLISQACLFWLSQGVSFAAFHLEEDRTYHQLRALAQLEGESRMTLDDWVRNHPDETHDAMLKHKETLESLGQSIWDAPSSDVSLVDLAGWVRERAAEGRRIIIVDPVTAADPGREPWHSDRVFVNECKRAMREHGASLIVVTHPRNANPSLTGQLDNHAGGQSYNRLTQSMLVLNSVSERDVTVTSHEAFGTTTREVTVNRAVLISKARNGAGTGKMIGFWFDPKSLTFREEGVVEKSKE